MKKALACLLALTILLATLSGCNVPNSSTASSAPAASASSETQTPEAGTLPLREEIDDKYKWDLTQLFATNADFEAAMDEMIRLSEEVLSYKGKLDSPETILAALTSNSKCTQLKQTILVYSTCTYWSDMNDTANNEIYAQGAAAIEKAEKNVQNLSIELTALDQSVLESLIDDERFADYRDYLSIILKQKENALPAETQVILNDIQSAMSTYQDIYNTVTGTAQFPGVTDSEGNSVDVSLATLFPVLNSADRKVRQDGYHALYGGLNEASGEVIAQAYKGHIAKSYLEAKLKGYDSVLAMSTANDQVPMELYDTVINTVKDYKDVQARYYELTRQALGLEEMTAYDQMAPVLPEKVDIPYDNAHVR